MIDKDTPIIELLRAYPGAREILIKYGMGCIGCMGSTTETIENGAKMHNINLELLMNELNVLKQEQ